GREPCRHASLGPREAPLPQPGPHPTDPRPVDRQISRAPGLGARRAQERAGGGDGMNAAADTRVTTQVYRVYIRATPQAIWDAITDPGWNQRFGYPGTLEYELRPGGAFRAVSPPEMVQAGAMPELVADGEVVEADPPRRLVQTWRFLMDPDLVAEG